MRVVFFGTPAFAVPSFEALRWAGVEVIAAVTQPDRPRGRSHSTLLPCPVKAAATAAGVPVLTPENPREPAFMAELTDLAPDLGVVVAYGHLLRPALLAIPPLGLVNVHASLLPRWRGAAPIHWAIKTGDAETGVSIMRVEAGLDSGGVWHTRRTPIAPSDTTGILFDRLAQLGADALLEALPRIASGEAPEPQDDVLATHAPKLDRPTARIDWQAPATVVDAHIRAMDPAPGAWTSIGGRDLKLFAPNSEPRTASNAPEDASPFAVRRSPLAAAPGTLTVQGITVMAACADAWLPLGEVTPAGGRRMPALTWYRGAQLPDDSTFA